MVVNGVCTIIIIFDVTAQLAVSLVQPLIRNNVEQSPIECLPRFRQGVCSRRATLK